MAKTNYSYEKRGRELEKQKKQEGKRQKKLNKKNEDKKEEVSESSSDNSLEKQIFEEGQYCTAPGWVLKTSNVFGL